MSQKLNWPEGTSLLASTSYEGIGTAKRVPPSLTLSLSDARESYPTCPVSAT